MMATGFRIGGDLEGTTARVRRHAPAHRIGPAREAAVVLVRRAVELGVTLIDTAYLYGGGQ